MLQTVFLLTPVYVNLIVGVMLISQSIRHRNRLWLAMFFLNSFLLFTGHFLFFNSYISIYRIYDFVFLFSLISFYPFYFLYIRSIFDFHDFTYKKIYHFIPSFIVVALFLTSLMIFPKESYENYLLNIMSGKDLINNESGFLAILYHIVRYFHVAQIVTYSVVIVFYVKGNYNLLYEYFSNTDKYQLRYFSVINLAFLILMSVPGIVVTLIDRSPFLSENWLIPLSSVVFSLMYLILGVYGLKQVAVIIDVNSDAEAEEINNLNYSSTNDLKNQIIRYFDSEKPYLNPEFKIWDIARYTSTNRTYISKLINSEFTTNFNNFVNSYRVEEAKQIISSDDKKNLTLEAIAELSGFGSPTSFIRAFKKFTGQTPTSFRNNIHKV